MNHQTAQELKQRVRQLERVVARHVTADTAYNANIAAITRLHQLGLLSTRKSKLSEVLTEILDAAIEITSADFGNIQLLVPATGCLKIEAQRGFSKSWVEFWNNVSEGEGACGAALQKRQRVIVEDVEKSKIFEGKPGLDVLLQSGVRAVQSTPIVSRCGKLLGMFSTHYKTPHRPDATTLKWVDLLSQQAADLIQQFQTQIELSQRSKELARLAGELTLAEHRERRRIADYLHDNLQQLLVGARLQAQAFLRSAKGKNVETLEILSKILKEAIEATRSLSREIAPPISMNGNLAETCHWLATDVKSRHLLEVEMEVRGGFEDLSESESIFLYTAARELLLNVAKHSGVLSAQLELFRESSAVVLRICDKGCGYDPASKSQGLGLFSIRERIGSMGGTLNVESQLQRGTSIMLELPVRAQVPAESDAPLNQTKEVYEGDADTRAVSPTGARRIRVVFVDDHRIVRESLVSLVQSEPDIEVVGQCKNGQEAVDCVESLKPDIFVMDGNMPVMDGMQATRAIKKSWPAIKVIGLSMMEEKAGSAKMRAAGVDVFVSKSGPTEDLIGAIRQCFVRGAEKA